ncbi:hypothetical protein [Micromonospora sp. SH-82]|uniref:hypothetical protein n=1 Tax=Micromonospora sp. SH-82 TaxID=3132938 RepID=UPI003EBE2355
MASFDDWVEAYEKVYRSLPASSEPPCPNCGNPTLRLVFTAPPGERFGFASFWCDTCLEGIHISRTLLPPGATTRSLAVPAEDREPVIPDYRLAL